MSRSTKNIRTASTARQQPTSKKSRDSEAIEARRYPPTNGPDGDTPGAGLRQEGKNHGAGDQREALFNGGEVGTFQDVMVRHQEVTLLRGILIEIDGECLNLGTVIKEMPVDGFQLYERHVRTWLNNHPVLRKAEVRFSGRWVHCILWLSTPVQITSDRRREQWDRIVEAVQGSLPADPEAPTLLAMTRPLGSVNAKTGRSVELIKEGEPVSEEEVLAFAEDLCHRGFATISQILFGSTTVSPCPLCGEQDSMLSADSMRNRVSDPRITNHGSCYHCRKVSLRDLIALVLKGRDKAPVREGSFPGEPAAMEEHNRTDFPFPIPAQGQGGR